MGKIFFQSRANAVFDADCGPQLPEFRLPTEVREN